MANVESSEIALLRRWSASSSFPYHSQKWIGKTLNAHHLARSSISWKASTKKVWGEGAANSSSAKWQRRCQVHVLAIADEEWISHVLIALLQTFLSTMSDLEPCHMFLGVLCITRFQQRSDTDYGEMSSGIQRAVCSSWKIFHKFSCASLLSVVYHGWNVTTIERVLSHNLIAKRIGTFSRIFNCANIADAAGGWKLFWKFCTQTNLTYLFALAHCCSDFIPDSTEWRYLIV